MKTALRVGVLAVLLTVTAAAVKAETSSRSLVDPTNTALTGSDLGAPGFADVYAFANNVALYRLAVPVAGTVTIISTGYASGGVDPYFTLFRDVGAGAVVFVASNYVQAFSTGGDFAYATALSAGS